MPVFSPRKTVGFHLSREGLSLPNRDDEVLSFFFSVLSARIIHAADDLVKCFGKSQISRDWNLSKH